VPIAESVYYDLRRRPSPVPRLDRRFVFFFDGGFFDTVFFALLFFGGVFFKRTVFGGVSILGGFVRRVSFEAFFTKVGLAFGNHAFAFSNRSFS
jgi:hypothetical protein